MSNTRPRSIFVIKAGTKLGKVYARLLIESLQAFGGEMSGNPVWLFATNPRVESCNELASSQVQVIPLHVPEIVQAYPFGDKVCVCNQAEALAPPGTHALIWFDLECLIIQPPRFFDIGTEADAAFRPVHIRNVGVSPLQPLDTFWKGIYSRVGVDDISLSIQSFVDNQTLRAYFNTHAFAVNPALGLMHRWYMYFEDLITDGKFQAEACTDERHQIFLFQALLSTLVAASIPPERIRLLPSVYNYPYNLHTKVPSDRRATVMNDLVCLTFEGRKIHPELVTDIQIDEPLRSWLEAQNIE